MGATGPPSAPEGSGGVAIHAGKDDTLILVPTLPLSHMRPSHCAGAPSTVLFPFKPFHPLVYAAYTTTSLILSHLLTQPSSTHSQEPLMKKAGAQIGSSLWRPIFTHPYFSTALSRLPFDGNSGILTHIGEIFVTRNASLWSRDEVWCYGVKQHCIDRQHEYHHQYEHTNLSSIHRLFYDH